MKSLNKIIKKVLKEQADEMYYFKSANGGTLGIPKHLRPTNIRYIDIDGIERSLNDENFLTNDWANWGKSGETPTDACKKHHPNEKLLQCLQKGYQTFTAQYTQGSVLYFEATDPISNERKGYRGCFRTGTNQMVWDFNKWEYVGYYPKVQDKVCWGIPWGANLTDKKEKSGTKSIVEPTKLEVNLLTNKSN
jgi:hypothetical protein